MLNKCPIKSHPKYKSLVKKYGFAQANKLFSIYEEAIYDDDFENKLNEEGELKEGVNVSRFNSIETSPIS